MRAVRMVEVQLNPWTASHNVPDGGTHPAIGAATWYQGRGVNPDPRRSWRLGMLGGTHLRHVVLALLALAAGGAAMVPGLASADAGVLVGMAVREGPLLCFYADGAQLPPRARLTLVSLGLPQAAYLAEVVRPGHGCAGNSGRLGTIIRQTGRTPQVEGITLGVAGQNTWVVKDSLALLSTGPGEPLTARVCASVDGVHVTAWRGQPLQGLRVFHGYVYLKMDLEPNCTKPETDALG